MVPDFQVVLNKQTAIQQLTLFLTYKLSSFWAPMYDS